MAEMSDLGLAGCERSAAAGAAGKESCFGWCRHRRTARKWRCRQSVSVWFGRGTAGLCHGVDRPGGTGKDAAGGGQLVCHRGEERPGPGELLVGEHLGQAAGAEAGHDEGEGQAAGGGKDENPGDGQGATPGLDLGNGMSEEEVAAGQDKRGADAGEDKEGTFGGRSYGKAIGGQEGKDETGSLYEDGGQGDGEAGAVSGHDGLQGGVGGIHSDIANSKVRPGDKAPPPGPRRRRRGKGSLQKIAAAGAADTSWTPVHPRRVRSGLCWRGRRIVGGRAATVRSDPGIEVFGSVADGAAEADVDGAAASEAELFESAS
jgi:hypothetical protein